MLWTSTAQSLQTTSSSERFHLAIAAGSLSSVLKQLSKQTGLQIGTQLNVTKSERYAISAFEGYATADEALKALLENTDLAYEWQDGRTIRIYALVVRPPRSQDNVNEVLVTGTRLDSVEAPIKVYGKGRIHRFGISSVADLSRYLTQQPYFFSEGHLQSSAQFFQMRGLGFDTTLVLINGRRVPPSANSIALNAVDLNNVPIMAVERIEVMSDSASAIYGADAIGGVVNVILKDRIEQPEVYLHYGQAHGGGTQRRTGVSTGSASKHLKSAFVLDYYETDPLMGSERELWRNQDYRRFGGRDYRVSTANPANVYSVSGQPLPGLAYSYAAVPIGASGPLTPADFSSTQGAMNLESAFRDWSITPSSHRASAYGSAEYSFKEDYSLFGEILAVSSDVTALRPPPAMTRHIVPAANPFNPFGVPVAVDYSFAGMTPTSHLDETDLLRIVGGCRGKIRAWQWEIAGWRHREQGVSTTLGILDPVRVAAATNSNNPQTALNLFSDGPAGASVLLKSLIGPAQSVTSEFSSTQLSAFTKGPVFRVGAQEAEWVVGAEWRRDEADFLESGEPVNEGRQIVSAFSEMRLPLLETLSVRMAARGDNYGNGKSIVNPQYGITWRPAQQWQLRAAYATSFRPPSLFELYMPTFQPSFPIADPLRGGEVSNVGLSVGGNRDLEPVTARSFAAGFVFSPSSIPVRLRGSYWQVVMRDRIIVPTYQELLKPDSALTVRVVRDAPGEQDLHNGWAGRVRSIDLRRLNYGDLQTSGIDLDTSLLLERRWGSLQLDLSVTWIDDYVSHDMNPILPSNRVGIANIQGTIPRWRSVGTLAWDYRHFGASTTATYVPSYQDADFAEGPLDRHIDSQILVDLQAWMDVHIDGTALTDGLTVTLGARNVFDRGPDFAHAGAVLGYDASQSELTRRFIYVRLSKEF